jgi:DNA repair protein RadC
VPFFATESSEHFVVLVFNEQHSVVSTLHIFVEGLHTDSVLVNRVKQLPLSHSD